MNEDSLRAGGQWALLIGIDKYPLMPESSLQGAVRDVETFQEHLVRRWGFDKSSILRRVDGQATQAGIREAFGQLGAKIGRDDIVVVFYAGHGSWRCDPEGSKRRADGREKTLVPADSGREEESRREIGGDEIHHWLQALARKTPYVTVILDCCHSGTMTRDPDLQERGITVDSTVDLAASPSPRDVDSRTEHRRSKGRFGPDGNYTLIAACKSTQAAVEARIPGKKRRRGLLTLYLLKRLEDAAPETTYQDLVDEVSLDFDEYFRQRNRSWDMDSKRIRQQPQLEGSRNRVVFGREEVPPLRYFEILQRSTAERVRIGGGDCHLLRPERELRVYPRGTKRSLTEGSTEEGCTGRQTSSLPIGRLRVVEVEGLESEAKILLESQDRPIQVKDRVVLASERTGQESLLEPRDGALNGEGDFEDLKLPVSVDAPKPYHRELSQLQAGIDSSPFLRRAGGDQEALEVVAREVWDEGKAGKSIPFLKKVASAVWAVNGPSSRRMPHQRIQDASSVGRVLSNLEKEARWRNLLHLENPGSPLVDKIRFVLKRQEGKAVWVPAGTRESPIFQAGERFAFEITNCHSVGLFVYVLSLGFGGGVNLLYPTLPGSFEILKSGRSVEVGTEREVCRFFLPQGYPYHPGTKPPGGMEREYLKILVTTEGTDLRFFFQDSYREGLAVRPVREAPNDLHRKLSFVMLGEDTLRGSPRQTEWAAWTYSLKILV